MIISSRTPEGDPNRCVVCGTRIRIEPSEPTRDAPCPACGQLNWWKAAAPAEPLKAATWNFELFDRIMSLPSFDRMLVTPKSINEMVNAKLDTVEVVMELEEEFDITIPDEVAEKITTVAAAVAYLESRQQELGTHESD